jgi:hypothetical protein
MKGTILKCLEEMVKTNYGHQVWEECLKASNLPVFHMFSITEDINEKLSIDLFVRTAGVVKKTVPEIFDEFGIHWSCVYAPRIYTAFYKGTQSTKEMVLKLDSIHNFMTQSIANARPPRFQYEWLNERELRLRYNSQRGLIDLFISLLKGLDQHYSCNTKIDKRSEEELVLVFD